MALKLHALLLLSLLLLPSLATGASEEVLLLWVALESGAFGELLLRALVGLAHLDAVVAQSEALLGLLGKVLVVGLGVVLCLRWSGSLLSHWCIGPIAESWVAGVGVWGEARLVLDFGLGNSIASLLIVPLALSSCLAPPVRSLLLVLGDSRAVVAVVACSAGATVLSSSAAASTTSASAATSTSAAVNITVLAGS